MAYPPRQLQLGAPQGGAGRMLVIDPDALRQMLAQGNFHGIGEAFCNAVEQAHMGCVSPPMGGHPQAQGWPQPQGWVQPAPRQWPQGWGSPPQPWGPHLGAVQPLMMQQPPVQMVPQQAFFNPQAAMMQAQQQNPYARQYMPPQQAGTPLPRTFGASPVAPGTNTIVGGTSVVFTGSYNWNGLVTRMTIPQSQDDLAGLMIGPFTIAGLPLIDGANQIGAGEYSAMSQCCPVIMRQIGNQQPVSLTVTNVTGANIVCGNPTFHVEPDTFQGRSCFPC